MCTSKQLLWHTSSWYHLHMDRNCWLVMIYRELLHDGDTVIRQSSHNSRNSTANLLCSQFKMPLLHLTKIRNIYKQIVCQYIRFQYVPFYMFLSILIVLVFIFFYIFGWSFDTFFYVFSFLCETQDINVPFSHKQFYRQVN